MRHLERCRPRGCCMLHACATPRTSQPVRPFFFFLKHITFKMAASRGSSLGIPVVDEGCAISQLYWLLLYLFVRPGKTPASASHRGWEMGWCGGRRWATHRGTISGVPCWLRRKALQPFLLVSREGGDPKIIFCPYGGDFPCSLMRLLHLRAARKQPSGAPLSTPSY